MEIKEAKFKVIVKPGSRENKIEGFDSNRKAYIISIRAKPEDNKANIEIVKFLSKRLKKKVRIASGFRSKEKFIKAE
ncbi:DUF167 domain-containing protein [Candidatus Woesearchaeota archaeon]|nr:DUF167 domain-containing protein [Candidatus Woesearchaeota archaeon]